MTAIDATSLRVDDFIQARREAPDEPIEVAEGIVAAHSNGVITMGTRTFDAAEGWVFDLIDRALTPLPTTLCEIDAFLRDGSTVRLMGKNDVWASEVDGQIVSADQILSLEVVA